MTKFYASLLMALLGMLITPSELKASHAMGADLTYVCTGPNQYQVNLSFFRDCNGIEPESSYSINVSSPSCGSDLTMTVTQQGPPTIITPLCPSEEDECVTNALYGVEEYTYSGTITLPPGCSDWELSWTQCCRNAAITTVGSPQSQDFYVTSQLDDTVSDCNNSPEFLNIPTPFTCVGQEVFYNHGAVDQDGDSLVFSLVDCLDAPGAPVTYIDPPYNGTNPLSTSTGVLIDPVTGAIEFTPDIVQVGVLCVLVEEYRDGVKIGEVVRDMQFTVINCTNTLPVASGIDGLADPANPTGTGVFEIDVCIGVELCFNVESYDVELTDPMLPQNILMEWNGAIADATFTVSPGSEPTGTFCWIPTDDDVGANSFTVQVTDDACPLLGSNTYTYTVNVIDNPNQPVDAGPDQQICLGETATLNATTGAPNAISYSWSPTTGLSSPNTATTDASPTSTTVYTVTTEYDDGCSARDDVIVEVVDAPTVSVFPNNIDICNGASAVLSASTEPGATLEWFDETGTSIATGSPYTATPVSSTFYTVIATNAQGCAGPADTAYVNLDEAPPAACVNIYVTTNGTGDGSRANPTDIVSGLAMAMCNNSVIKVAEGTYNIDAPLNLSSFLTLEGGFDPTTWIKTSTAGATTINRTANNPEGPLNAQRLVALQANGATGFRLQDLTITTDDAIATGQEGMSTYGLHLVGCSTYDIVRCQIFAGNASDGVAGVNGANGANGIDGANGLSGDTGVVGSASGGAGGAGGGAGPTAGGSGGNGGDATWGLFGGSFTNGGAGQASAAGVAGGSLGEGFNEAIGASCDYPGLPTDGGAGANGNDGVDGTNGTGGAAATYLGGFFIPGGLGTDGLSGTDGEGGGGGGGGGGQGSALGAADGGGGGGGGGAGGGGGTAGTGGAGGGGSFSVFLFANGAGGNIVDCNVIAGALGLNGTGGAGSTGGVGGDGGSVGADNCESGEGGIGGDGGNGGIGGSGGNGGGDGEAMNIYIDGNALATSISNFDLTLQPEITASNVNCTELDVDFTGPNASWSFAPSNLFSGPAPNPAANTVVAFSDIDRYDVINGFDVYTGFHNVSFADVIIPDILNDAPQIGQDTFLLCVGDFAAFNTSVTADSYNWAFDGAITNPGSVPNISSQFNTASGAAPFEITLSVSTDCCGDSPLDTVWLWVDPTPVGTISGDNEICIGETTTLTLNGIAPDDIVTWTPTIGVNVISQTAIEVNPQVTTTYVATITNSRNSCPNTADFEVTVNALPSLTLSPTPLTCGDDGAIVISVAGGSGNYTYEWSHDGSIMLPFATNLASGTYSVTVTDNGTGCTDDESVFVAPGNAPVAFILNNTDITCTGANDGTAEAGASNGTTPYTYTWSNGDTGPLASNLPPGPVTVTVTDASGCETTTGLNVFEPPVITILVENTVIPPCPDVNTGSIEVAASGGTAPLSYTWSNGSATDTIQDLFSGLYTLTVTDVNGCTATQEVNLGAGALLTVTPTVTNVLCANATTGAIDLEITGGSLPLTFDWDNDGTGDNDDTEDLSNLSGGIYNVTITDVNGCATTASAEILEPTELTSITTATSNLCAGANEGSIDLEVSGGTPPYTFDWDNDGTGDNDDTEDLAMLASGTYNVTITDANGCTISDSETITVPAQLTAAAVGDFMLCNGDADGDIDLTVMGGTAPYTFDWDNDGTGDNDDTEDLAGLSGGAYSVTVTDTNGCTATASAGIVEPNVLTLSVDAAPDLACNGNADGTIDITVADGTAPYTFDWDNDGTGDNDDTEDLTGLAAGTYGVTVTDANACTATGTATIAEPSALAAIITLGFALACNGDSDGQISITVADGTAPYTYDWDNDGTGDNDDPENLINLPAGTYSVTVTDANGCTIASMTEITEPVLLTASATGDAILCNGDADGDIDLTVNGGTMPYTYDWDNAPDVEDPSGLSGGIYTVTITDMNGCITTASAEITEPTTLTLTVDNVNSLACNGDTNGSIEITVADGTAPYTYDWDNDGTGDNDDTEDLIDLVAGTYGVTVTDANGCTATGTGTITEPLALTLTLTPPADLACAGDTNGSIDITITEGTAPYTFDWDNDGTGDNDDTEDLADLTAGTYSVTATDTNGCTITGTATINEPAALTASATGDAILCNGDADGDIDLTVNGGTMPYTYDWDNAPDVEDPSGLSGGIYTATITDANGCTTTASAEITEPTTLTLTVDNVNSLACNGDTNGSIEITVADGTAPYTYDWDNDGTGDNDDAEDLTDLVAGTYGVTVTDANGCTATGTGTITEPLALTLTLTPPADLACAGDTNGSIDITITEGTAPYTFDWDNDGTGDNDDTEDLADLTAGTYNVTATDANGCTITGTATINEPAALTASATADAILCSGDADGDIDLTVNGGTMPYTYDWDNAPDVEDPTGLSGGIYTATITDANGCTTTASAEITEPTTLTLTVDNVNSLACNGDTNGSIEITVADGTAPYTYDWDNDGTGDNDDTEDLTDLVAGTYGVTVTDANGCTATGTGTITEPLALTLTLTPPADLACAGDANGSIDITITEGTAPYTFDWDNDGIGDNDDTEDLADLTAGTYSVTATDTNGCTITGTATINEPAALTASATGDAILCNGDADGDIDLTVNGGTMPYTYDWDNAPDVEDPSGLSGGIYTVTITDANGCITTASAEVTEPTALVIDVLPPTDVECNGGMTGAIDITVTGGTTNYTYAWDGPGGPYTTEDLSGLSAGNYTLTVTDANGCIANETVTINQASTLLLDVLPTTDLLCNGDTNGAVSIDVTGGTPGYTYTWDGPGGPYATEDLTNLTAGTYSVTATDASGCAVFGTATIGEPDALIASATGDAILCNGDADGDIDLTVTGGIMPYTYDWDNAPDVEDPSGLSGGIYTVTITDANGCITTASAEVTEPTALSISVLPPTDVECNGGMTGAIDITVTGGTTNYTYAWDGPGGPYTTEDLSGLSAGNYTLTVTDANGCVANETVTINQASTLLLDVLPTTDLLCNGDTNGAVSIDVTGGTPGYMYAWDGPGGPYATEGLTNLTAGTYGVTATDASGCAVFGTATIGEPDALIASATGDAILCNGDADGDIDLTVTGGTMPYTYDWDNAPDVEDPSGLSGGIYTVTITDMNGCITTASAEVTEPTALVIDVLPPTDVECNGGMTGAIDITVTGGTTNYTYAWDGPGGPYTTEDLSGLSAGNYTLTVTDANGCISNETVTINQASTLVLDVLPTSDLLCNGDTNGAVNIDVTGGTAPYTYDWDNDGTGDNDDTEDLTNLPAGTYNITATDDSGCAVFGTATIGEPTALATASTTVDVNCFGGNTGSIDLTVTDGTPPYTYNWDNTPDVEDPTGLTAGTYNITVTDANGCTVTDAATINEPTELIASAIGGTTSCAGVNDGMIDLTVSGSVPPYTFDWDNDGTGDNDDMEDPASLAAGTYSVTVTDANGCTAIASATIVDAAFVTASATVIDDASCSGSNDGAASATGSGGTGTYTYEWTSGETSQTATGLDVGLNIVTVTDGNGCQGTASVNISSTVIVSGNGVETDVSCNGGSDGEIELFPSGGDAPYIVNWSTGAGNVNPLTGLAAGQYTVTIFDNNGCNTVETYDIGEPDALTVNVDNLQGLTCNGDNSGSIIISVTGGTPNYTYTWSHDATVNTATPTGLAAGNYTVTITDDNACTIIENITLTEPTELAGTADVISDVLCFGDSNGVVSATVTGGTAPYSFNWSNGDTANPTLSCPAGAGSVVVTDVNGCVLNLNFVVGQPDELIGTATDGQTSCTGVNDGSVSSTITGGTGAYTYSWDGPGGPYTTPNPSGLPAGTFNLTVTDGNGCEAFASAMVTEATSVTAAASVVDDASCIGSFDGSATVSAVGGTGAGTYTFEWSTTPIQTTQTAINLDPISYTVTVTDGNGCQGTASVSIASTVNVQPNGVTTDVNCNGGNDGSITLSPTGGDTPYTFAWDNGLAPVNPQTTLLAGTYTVTVFDNNGCGVAETYTINEPTTPLAISVDNVQQASCIPGNDGEISISVSGGTPGYTYTWTPTGANSPTISNLPSGTYQVTVTDANGCEATENINVPNPSGLVASVTANSDVLCFGDANGSATASQTGGAAPYTYLWSSGEVTAIANNLPSGSNSVTVTDMDGCSDIATVNIGTPNLLEATASAINAGCAGSTDGTVTATGTGGTSPYSFDWGVIGTGPTINNVGFGTYTVTITDANNCLATATTTLSEPLPVTVSVTSQATSCFGGSDGQATATAGGGTAPYTYLWDNGETSNPTVTLNAGTHIVTVTDNNGCEETGSVVVNEPTQITPDGLGTTPVTCFGGNDGTATISASGGTAPYTYTWNTTPTQTGNTAIGLSAGTYSVVITDANNCSLPAIDVPVIEPDTPVSATTSATDALCNGSADGTVSVEPLGGTPNYTYLWNTGATSQNVDELTAGIYTVTVTDANNCTTVESVTVGEPTAIIAALNTQDVICFGEANGSIQIDTTYGGSGPYVYSLNGGNFGTDTIFNDLTTGDYDILVQDANGCETSYSIVIAEPFELSVDLGVDITVLFGNETELYAVPNTAAPLTYIWTPSEGLSCGLDTLTACDNPSVTPLENTTYTVTIVDTLGCSATDEVLVLVDKRYDVYIPNVFSPDFDGTNDVFMIHGGQMVQQVNSFRIYDRWGEMIWQAENFPTDDSDFGWDGSFSKKQMNPGVFVYYAEVEFIDGHVITYKGDVTLVK